MKTRKFVLFLSFLSLFILLLLTGLSFLVTSPLKARVVKEAGEEISELDFYKNPEIFRFFMERGLSLINIKMLTDQEELLPNKVGDYTIQFLVNGRTESSFLSLKDSRPPEVQVKDVVIPAGVKVSEDDFILSIWDATKTKTKINGLSAYQKAKKSGVYKIVIEVTDDGKNKTKKTAKLYALPLKKKAEAELGESEVKAQIFLKDPSFEGLALSYKEGFIVSPLLKKTGVYTVPITARIGKEEKNLELKLVVKDRKPPFFLGLKDFTVLLGEELSYRQGIRVEDNQAEELSFTVDASKVNLKKEGSYPVIYRAEDKAGNKTEEKRQVHVLSSAASHVKEVKAYVSDTLKELIRNGMTEEEKLRSIFSFCHQVNYSGTSVKDNLIEAAYQGFKTRTGDCFTYYAMASVLLKEAGFTEEMVKREGGNSRHYWNLVKSGDDWYHFDSCPIAKSSGFLPFMVSDEELLSFSEAYGKRFPERKGYYHFNKDLYPKRADHSLRKKS